VKIAAAHDVSHPSDVLSKVRWSCAIETAVHQNTDAELYPLWDTQPVKSTLRVLQLGVKFSEILRFLPAFIYGHFKNTCREAFPLGLKPCHVEKWKSFENVS